MSLRSTTFIANIFQHGLYLAKLLRAACILFAVLVCGILLTVNVLCVVGTAELTAVYLIIHCGCCSRPLAIPAGPREDGRDEGCD
jgi:hypothetical protein